VPGLRPDEDLATISRVRDADEMWIVRYWSTGPGRVARGHDPDS
jgi:hypothetical protein